MGGGLMQLVAYGAQDIYLTGNPQITFFKVVYRRHTNFSMEAIEQTIVGSNTIGSSESQGTVTISRNGDLVSSVYVTSSTAGIMDGDALVKEVYIEIGGQMIDRHYKEWNQIWNELSTPASKVDGFRAMKVATHDPHKSSGDVTNFLGAGLVQVPLNFWFCRNIGLALPLIALQYHEVDLKFTWGNNTSINYKNNSDTGGCGSAYFSDSDNKIVRVYCDYIFLDTDERRRFAQVSHEYLIEQVQMHSLLDNKSNELTFNHPVKELIWTSGHDNVYKTAKLVLNGHDRFSEQEEEYFQLRQPYQYHTSVPQNNIPNHVYRVEHHGDLLSQAAGGYIAAAGLKSAAMPKYGLNFVKVGGTGDVLSAIPSKTVSIETATDISSAILIGASEANSLFRSGSVNIGDKHRFVIHRHTFDAANNHAGSRPTIIFEATVKYIILDENTTLANASGHLGPISTRANKYLGNEVRESYLTAGGAADDITDNAANALLIAYDKVATFDASNGGALDDGNDMLLNTGTVIVSDENIGGNSVAGTSLMNKRINVYSFARKPEEHQPSGTCNFSRIDSAILETGVSIGSTYNIYAVNYNVLRIMSGMGGLAYSN